MVLHIIAIAGTWTHALPFLEEGDLTKGTFSFFSSFSHLRGLDFFSLSLISSSYTGSLLVCYEWVKMRCDSQSRWDWWEESKRGETKLNKLVFVMLVLGFKLPLVDGDVDVTMVNGIVITMVKVVGKNMAMWWVYWGWWFWLRGGYVAVVGVW